MTLPEVPEISGRGAKPQYRTPFGGFWSDRIDAEACLDEKVRLGQITPSEEVQLRFWLANGYLIIENAVSEARIDGMLADLDDAWQREDNRIIVDVTWQGCQPLKAGLRELQHKLQDFYFFSENARAIVLCDKVTDFLKLVFERDVLATQSLSFEVGLQQPLHQDTAYVVMNNSPLEFAASWIALEDIQPGSGELEYFSGSHTLEAKPFAENRLYTHPDLDGDDPHVQYLKELPLRCEAAGMERKRFTPKKGDALIWSAGLAHGGTHVEDSKLTRKSIVTHYCPMGISPAFFVSLGSNPQHCMYKPGLFYNSRFQGTGETQ